MNIAIGGMKQETNCFSSMPPPISSWRIWTQEEIFHLRGAKSSEIGGILQVADCLGWKICLHSTQKQYRRSPQTVSHNKLNDKYPYNNSRPDRVIYQVCCCFASFRAAQKIVPYLYGEFL